LRQTVSWYLENQGAETVREKILVYGANGWIGRQFVSLLEKEGVEYAVGKKRLGDDPDESIEEEILSVSPTHVASFIGRTHGPGNNTADYLEGGPDKLVINIRDNLYGPLLLAELCRKLGIHFTYMGSGCIFRYDEEHPIGSNPFTEDDRPNHFGSSYSVVKGCMCVYVCRSVVQQYNLKLTDQNCFGDPDWLIDAETWPSANLIDKYV